MTNEKFFLKRNMSQNQKLRASSMKGIVNLLWKKYVWEHKSRYIPWLHLKVCIIWAICFRNYELKPYTLNLNAELRNCERILKHHPRVAWKMLLIFSLIYRKWQEESWKRKCRFYQKLTVGHKRLINSNVLEKLLQRIVLTIKSLNWSCCFKFSSL